MRRLLMFPRRHVSDKSDKQKAIASLRPMLTQTAWGNTSTAFNFLGISMFLLQLLQ